MIIVGIVALAVAAVWYFYKLYVAYSSFGGTNGMQPVNDAAMYPPMLVAFGLWWVLSTNEIQWEWWIYILIWLGGTAFALGTIKLAEILGDKPL